MWSPASGFPSSPRNGPVESAMPASCPSHPGSGGMAEHSVGPQAHCFSSGLTGSPPPAGHAGSLGPGKCRLSRVPAIERNRFTNFTLSLFAKWVWNRFPDFFDFYISLRLYVCVYIYVYMNTYTHTCTYAYIYGARAFCTVYGVCVWGGGNLVCRSVANSWLWISEILSSW